jgi:DnaJ-class molecular chaperone
MKDYFKILGVEPAASDDAVKKAYRSLAMKHHPDRAGGDSIQFKEIQEAYNVLSDPQKRSEWEQAQHGNPFSGGFHFNFGGNPVDVNDIFRQFNAGQDPFGRFGQDPFGGFRQAQPLRKNRDLRIAIELALSSTLEPQVKHLSLIHI